MENFKQLNKKDKIIFILLCIIAVVFLAISVFNIIDLAQTSQNIAPSIQTITPSI